MRSLYPAARHDRFIHSLGVYHLGRQAFAEFRKNSRLVIESFKNSIKKSDYDKLQDFKWWDKQQLLFEIACLMHDCAHAPFSHTTEEYYNLKKNDEGTPRLKEMLEAICTSLGDDDFKHDFEIQGNESNGLGAAHEKLSSFIILKEYQDPIKRIFKSIFPQIKLKNSDYVYICRMIIGCKYSKKSSIENSLKNCIISLLNSSTIDVDGLDYIVRDSQMSGASSFNVDYHRILNSFTILPAVLFENKTVSKHDAINGVWLKDSIFNISSFTGQITGAFWTTITDDTISTSHGVVERGNSGLVRNEDFSKTMIFSDSKNGEIALLSSSKIKDVKEFVGKISGRKILNINEELNGGKLTFVLAYDKRCLSIIQNTIDARNNEYLWIYSHPKVQYNSHYLQCGLLIGASRYLCYLINKAKKAECRRDNCFNCSSDENISDKKEKSSERKLSYEDFIPQILGYEEFFDEEDRKICDELKSLNFYFNRSSDDDLNALFKRIYLSILSLPSGHCFTEYERMYCEYASRKQRKVLWKSFMEKQVLVDACKTANSDFRGIQRMLKIHKESIGIKTKAYSDLTPSEQKIFNKYRMYDVLIIGSKAKTKKIDFPEFFVKYGDRSARLCDVFDSKMITDSVNKEIEYIFFNGEEIEANSIAEIDRELTKLYIL